MNLVAIRTYSFIVNFNIIILFYYFLFGKLVIMGLEVFLKFFEFKILNIILNINFN